LLSLYNGLPKFAVAYIQIRKSEAERTGMRDKKWVLGFVFVGVLALIAASATVIGGRSSCEVNVRPRTEIFEGIIYGCEQLEPTAEGRGVVHWLRVDLTAPGIELYVTPLDRTALDYGWQYRLRRVGDVMEEQNLAVAINHVISHLWEHTNLLWFDDQLMPTLERSKPPSATALGAAKWGVGGQGVGLQDGIINSHNSRVPNSRTAVAIDRESKLLFLAVGEYISPRLILLSLANLGAKDGILLDGGSSTSMAIGRDSASTGPRILSGGGRPVATYFGVRARPTGATVN
jgi:hypothetical protein